MKQGVNRAIPDAQFESFVDRFARRVAGWDHFALAAAGMQTDVNFEVNFGEEELRFVGSGPWK